MATSTSVDPTRAARREAEAERRADEFVAAHVAAMTGTDDAADADFARLVKEYDASIPITLPLLYAIVLAPMFAMNRKNRARQKQIDELVQRPILEYRGTWKQDTVYGVGNLVTHSGSLWIGKTASVSRRPGGPDNAWQLCCKRGDDGRDGRDGTNCPHCGEATGATA